MRLDFQIVWLIIIFLSAIEMTFALKSPIHRTRRGCVTQRQLRVKRVLTDDCCLSFDDSGRDRKLSALIKRSNRRNSVDRQHLRTKTVLSVKSCPSADEAERDKKLEAMIMRTNRSGAVRQRQLRPKRLLAENACPSFNSFEKDEKTSTVKPIVNSKYQSNSLAAKAAIEAKQANDEMASAVKIASDRIKLEYAEKAASAARAAEAVLVSKKQMMQQLEMEVREAELVVQEEKQELSAVEAHSQLALKTYTEAKEELKLLMNGIKMARENLINSEMVAAACHQFMADKSTLAHSAQKRLQLLLQHLAEARADHAKTKQAADKAMSSAKMAKQRILTRDEGNCSI